MKLKSSKFIQTCSSCGKTGHNKRRCVYKKTPPVALNQQSVRSADISVTGVSAPPSVHVVDLRDHEREKQFERILPYHEPSRHAPVRAVVDFASAIRSAKRPVSVSRVAEKKRMDQVSKSREHMPSIASADWMHALQSYAHTIITRAVSLYRTYRIVPQAIGMALLLAIPFPVAASYQKWKETAHAVVAKSAEAFSALQISTAAAFNKDVEEADAEIQKSIDAFRAALSLIQNDHPVALRFFRVLPFIGTRVRSGEALLQAGEHMALGNQYLINGVKEAGVGENASPTDRLKIFERHLAHALPQYEAAVRSLSTIDTDAIPESFREPYREGVTLFAAFTDDMNDALDVSEMLSFVLGSDGLRRYLILFQNPHEIRPTGGFMGSFAVVDIERGRISRLEVPPGGTYHIQGQLPVFVSPPLPLQLVNKRWEFQDANWFPDFPASAKQAAWFYREARGTTVDGVIAVNGTVLERLLAVMGPISSDPKFAVTLAEGSALESLEKHNASIREKKIYQPKAVIGDLLEETMTRASSLSETDMLRALLELHGALKEREIQIYFEDAEAQKQVSAFHWTGEIQHADHGQDYLMVVNTNLQGEKSDAKIKQTVEYSATVADDGMVMGRAVIRREHTGVVGESLYGVNNVSYLRLYVPLGAELVDAGGFTFPAEDAFFVPEEWYGEDARLKEYEKEDGVHIGSGTRVTREFGKTAFGNWVMTPPGGVSEVFFIYRLPFRLWTDDAGTPGAFSRYTLFIQKQSGTHDEVLSSVQFPAAWSSVWVSSPDIRMGEHGVDQRGILTSDRLIGAIMRKDVQSNK